MNVRRFLPILLSFSAILLVIAASASISSEAVSENISECVRVSVFTHPNTTFLPEITGGSGSVWTGPIIQEVAEDSAGCLLFVGDVVHFTLKTSEGGGTASVDIGQVRKGIRLYDDGTNGDSTSGDGIYERSYVTTTEDLARSEKIIGHYISADGLLVPSVNSKSSISIADWQDGASSVAPVYDLETEEVSGAQFAADRAVILFSMDSDLPEIQNLLVEKDLLISSWLPSLMAFEVDLEGLDYELLREQLLVETIVEEVERNYVIEPLAPPLVINDRYVPIQQANYLNMIRAKLGWEITQGDPGVLVAIIDTGVDRTHPDLVGQVLRSFTCPRCGTNDWRNHGTSVAGLVAAEAGIRGMSGVAPNVRLLSFRLPTWPATLLALDEHIVGAIDADADVINMSVGESRCSSSVRRAIDHASAAGVVLVAAAGNRGEEIVKNDNCLLNFVQNYPASFTNVLAVGALTNEEAVRDDSSFGNEVVYAPGTELWATRSGGGYQLFGNTSGAAPQVTALAALILSIDPNLSNIEVIDTIIQSADILPGEPGFGRINVYRALKIANGEVDPGPDPLPDQVTDLDIDVQGGILPQVNLTWTPPIDDYEGVHIYRYERNRDDILLLEGGLITGDSYIDSRVSVGHQYQYYVFAVDSIDQESMEFAESQEFIIPSDGTHIFAVEGDLDIQANSMAEQGDYVYLGSGNRLIVVDVSNLQQPRTVGQTQPVPEEIGDIVVNGSFVYAATGSDGMRIFDVSNPSRPSEISHFPLSWGQKAISVYVRGAYAYLGIGQFAGGMQIINIVSPRQPYAIGMLGAPYPHDIALSGNYAYLPSQIGAHGYDGMVVADISNPTDPQRISEFIADDVGDPEGIDIQSNYAYIAEMQSGQGGYGVWGGGLRVVSVANPRNPFQVGHYNETFRFARDVEVEGDLAYVGALQDGLRIIDVSSPSQLMEVAYYSDDSVSDVEVWSGIIYLAGENFSILRCVTCGG